MWEGIAPVDAEYAPVIYEGEPPALASVVNAGPSIVKLEAWDERRPEEKAEANVAMELYPGAFRSLRGRLIRCSLKSGNFAAIGWRIIA